MAKISTRRKRRRRLLLLGGFAALIAGALLKRDQVAGLLPRSGAEPPAPPAPAPAPAPGPSNYDAPGPVANTATAVPVPEAQTSPTVDEAEEEAAAAAEAANIGGTVSDYAGPAGEPADEAERPLAEAGEGEAEGQEQAEAELAAAAEPTAPGMSPEQHQIEDAIASVDDASAGEQVEPVVPPETGERDETADRPAPFPDEDEREAQSTWGPGGWSPPRPAERPAEPSAPEPSAPGSAPGSKDDEDDGGDWQTWSGRSVNP